NLYANRQRAGFFGISLPHWHTVETVLIGDRGLLVASPAVLAAAVGLLLLRHRHRREVTICVLVTLCYLALEFCYFLPYGGVSPRHSSSARAPAWPSPSLSERDAHNRSHRQSSSTPNQRSSQPASRNRRARPRSPARARRRAHLNASGTRLRACDRWGAREA